MNSLRWIARALIVVAMIVGTVVSIQPKKPVAMIDGYTVLTANFHVHMFPGDSALLSPWDTVLEARRNNFDVIALTSQSQVWTAKIGRLFSRLLDGPLVIVGEEVHAPTHHLLAIGIESTIDWRVPVADAIAEVHRQGGVAIAAHPRTEYWKDYDDAAIKNLDGTEVVHPAALVDADAAEEFKRFYRRKPLAAIGDSDWRTGPIGICRTFVFVREVTEHAVLNAIRERQTVVYDRGEYFGDEHLIALLKAQGMPQVIDPFVRSESAWVYFSRIAGGVGLLFAIVLGPSIFGWRKSTRYA